MSDGTIKIDIMIDNKPVSVASKELDKLELSGQDAGKGVKATEDGLKGVGQESQKSSGNVKKFATALGLVAIGAVAFQTLKASMDDAISRFDTLNNFPRVLKSMGFEAEESEKAINKLSDGIDGLPTKLDDVATTAQRIAVMTGDLDGAVDTTLALNNAFLSSGASTEDARRGLEQYVQMLSKGEVDLQSWRTLQETMPVALNKTAEAFQFTGKSAQNDLYDALKKGDIAFDQFNSKLIELSNATGGFADMAKESSMGFATSISNLRNAAAKGIADVIDRFNKLSVAVTGKEIPEHIDGLKSIVNASFNAIGTAIEKTTPIVAAFASGVSATMPVVKALTPVLIGMATAYAMHAVISATTKAIKESQIVIAATTAIKKAHTLAMTESTTGYLANAAASKVSALATAARSKLLVAATTAELLLTRQITLGQAAKLASAAASRVLGAALKFMMGPVGWVTAGIGALAGATVALVKWFNRSSAEVKKMKAETEELGDATGELIDSMNSTSDAYRDNAKNAESSAKKNSDLAKQIDELSSKENKSAADKALLQSHIESLNGSIDGLNLAYDEEAGALNMSSKELQARLDLMKETETGMAAQERLTEIIEEQNAAQMQLDEINEKRAEWNKLLANGGKDAREAKEEIAGLDEQEAALNETIKLLGEQYGITQEQIVVAAANATTAVEEGNLRQITSYEELKDEHKAAFDSMKTVYDELVENATNAFDRMNEESKVSGEEMIANLEHNQEMTRQWGENIAELYNRAGKASIDDGFVKYLEGLGPSAAAEVQEVANMSESELQRYSELMAEGAHVAGESLKTGLGDEFDDAVDVMVKFVDDGSQTLREKIESSGFDEIGSMVPEGFAGGIDDNAQKAENASKNMADDTTKAAEEALGINSPSRVFKEMGAAPIGVSGKKIKRNSEIGAYMMRTIKFKEAVIVA